MYGDPASRRARSVVLLVVITVALPSLVLSALGVAAIRNEEVATKRRIETLHQPLLHKAAENFNTGFDRLIEASGPALGELLAWSRNEGHDVTRFRRFIREHPAATNFFILDDDGAALTPNFSRRPTSECCVTPACFRLKDLGPRRHTNCSQAKRRADAEKLLGPDCSGRLRADPKTLKVGRKLLLDPVPTDPQGQAKYIEDTLKLGQRLTDPTRHIDADWSQDIAKAMMFRFEALPSADRRWVGGVLAIQAMRKDLLEGLSRLARTKRHEVVVAGFDIDKLPRVVALLHDGDRTAGFEIAPTPLEREMQSTLVDRGLDDRLRAIVGPMQAPKWYMAFMFPGLVDLSYDEVRDRLITWLLCHRSRLHWAFELVIIEEALFEELGHSRTLLYLWSLVLVGLALVGGIIYTVRSVIREARLSRLKTDFVSSVSHDLRTPLTSIRLFSETLHAERYANDDERREFLQIIIEEAERLSRLTERILDFSRMEAGRKAYRKTPTDLRKLIEHALQTTQSMIEAERFDVDLQIPDNLPLVSVDRDAMLEVFINLFSNAIKYSPTHRWMGILVTAHEKDVCVMVQDRGIGIRKTDQQRIFEKFYRVDNRRTAEVGGSGIGLSLVKHIVANHGGSVDVESTPGAGSTFLVRLPNLHNTKETSWTASWS
ncbi:MAG: ATP-binding protein [Myxococcota bacterium]